MSEKYKLKDCPFCGANPSIDSWSGNERRCGTILPFTAVKIRCDKCIVEKEMRSRSKTKIEMEELAATWWNKREMAQSKWIKCSDRRPKHGQTVLLKHCDDDVPRYGRYDQNHNWFISVYDFVDEIERISVEAITHWMELPTVPREDL
jgi:ribosomal protein L40E